MSAARAVPRTRARHYRLVVVPLDDESDDDVAGVRRSRCHRTTACGAIRPSSARRGLTDASTARQARNARYAAPRLWASPSWPGWSAPRCRSGSSRWLGGFTSKVVEKPVIEKVPGRGRRRARVVSPAGVVGVTRADRTVDRPARRSVEQGLWCRLRRDVPQRRLPGDRRAPRARRDRSCRSSSRTARSLPATSSAPTRGRRRRRQGRRGHLPSRRSARPPTCRSGRPRSRSAHREGASGGPSVTVGVVSALGQQVNSVDGVEPARHDRDRRR